MERLALRRSTAVARARIAGIALVVVTALVLTSEFSGSRAASTFWDNVTWTVAYVAASIIGFLGYSEASGSTRIARGWFFAGLVAMTLGQIVWNVQAFYDWFPFPGPSDLPFALVGACLYAGVATQIRDLPRGERGAYALDAIGITLVVLAVTLALHTPRIGHFGTFAVVVLVSYAVLHIGAAGAALVVILARRVRLRGANVAFVCSLFAMGLSWVYWNWWMLADALEPGVFLDYSFAYCTLAIAITSAEWDVAGESTPERDRRYYVVSSSVPLLLVVTGAVALVLGRTSARSPTAPYASASSPSSSWPPSVGASSCASGTGRSSPCSRSRTPGRSSPSSSGGTRTPRRRPRGRSPAARRRMRPSSHPNRCRTRRGSRWGSARREAPRSTSHRSIDGARTDTRRP